MSDLASLVALARMSGGGGAQGRCCIELPAGLKDGDEAPEATAERELLEETGYCGTCGEVSPIVAGEPGMTNNSLRLVMMDVDLDAAENVDVKPRPEARCRLGPLCNESRERFACAWPAIAALVPRPSGLRMQETEAMLQRHLLPIHSFQSSLAALAESTGYCVDSRLFAMAIGITLPARKRGRAKGLPALPIKYAKASAPEPAVASEFVRESQPRPLPDAGKEAGRSSMPVTTTEVIYGAVGLFFGIGFGALLMLGSRRR